ncbi:MAG: oligoendopeptidase F [Alphaproteobacteria bacterium]|nr:oligoendopeptidase F [Alphaproteobacteria bacterium]MBU1517058.1 oligoendopeptidase F [Alphaproteobacteria bacterium]MBU2093677.1 oligoendopeptidase F [Alphaproteobacteria bacterium]MBU2154001.1 oligoendopeptidase F [Alphaproteobacteria bacterium]MBU2308723.1 oligoendopeptidase F [Alphaproteobacteria bacterium]
MTNLSRREAFLLAAAAAATPALALAAEPVLPMTWDLTQLYPTDEAWTAERKAVEADLPKILAFKGRLGESAATLKAASRAISDVTRRALRLLVYATLKGDENLQTAADQERRMMAQILMGKLGEATAWTNPEILAVGATKIEAFVAGDPDMAKFRFGFENTLRQAPHTLDDAGEALLASTTSALAGPQQIRNQLVLSDIPWPEITVAGEKVRLDSQGFTAVRATRDRTERKAVFDTFFGAFKTYESSLGATLATKVQGDIFTARARKYPSSLAAAVDGPNIPEAVYRTLIAEANRGLPILHRYFDIRRRLLGLADMGYWDIYPPVTKLDARFDVPTSRKIAMEALKPLGPEYGAEFAKATAAGWVDVLPRKGKAAGAYMFGAAYDVHPYLLLNHNGDYESLSTYAHEWGHAMHTLLAQRAQPFELSNYPTFTAEVASTVNEQLLVAHMLKGAKGKDERLFYLDRVCETMRGTFYRQTMFAEFELAIHETAETGQALSGKRLSNMYFDLLQRYHGPKVTIAPAYGLEWALPGHFYRDFYVYQYATSVTAASAFAERILGGKAAERDAYLGALKAGGSDYPVDVLKKAGVDMTSPEPYRAMLAKFSRTLDEMERLLG